MVGSCRKMALISQLESLRFSRHAGLDKPTPAGTQPGAFRCHMIMIIFWIPASAGMTVYNLYYDFHWNRDRRGCLSGLNPNGYAGKLAFQSVRRRIVHGGIHTMTLNMAPLRTQRAQRKAQETRREDP